MLKTYEAIIQDGQVKWLAEKPDGVGCKMITVYFDDCTTFFQGLQQSF